MIDPATRQPSRLRAVLSVVFLLTLFLGPGLGAHLAGGDPDAPRFLFGVPALYLWLVGCWMVMASCILVAALRLWKESD